MARKQVKKEKQDRRELIANAFGEIEQSKVFLEKHTESAAVKMDIADLLKDIIQKQLRKDYDPEVEANIFINPERGDFEVYILKTVVDEVDLPSIEIGLDEVSRIDESLELGDMYEEGPVNLEDYLTRRCRKRFAIWSAWPCTKTALRRSVKWLPARCIRCVRTR